MQIEEFITTHQIEPSPINEIVNNWVIEKEVDDFLGTQLMGGVIIGDLIAGGTLLDIIPPELKEGFKNLMGSKADTLPEIRQIILEKIKIGGESERGLINKIQGQLGEDQFLARAGGAARLADSGNQEGYDVIVPRGQVNEYVQVKVYNKSGGVIDKMREVNEKTEMGEILGESGETITSISFAVNSNIYEEVVGKAKDLGLQNKIYNIGITRDQLRDGIITEGFDNVANPLETFFLGLLGGAVTGAALHGLVNGFLVWRGAKERQTAIEDTLYGSSISVGGLIASYTTEAVMFAKLETALGFLAGPVGGLFVLGAGVGMRGILKRFSDRRFLVDRLVEGNIKLSDLNQNLAAFEGI